MAANENESPEILAKRIGGDSTSSGGGPTPAGSPPRHEGLADDLFPPGANGAPGGAVPMEVDLGAAPPLPPAGAPTTKAPPKKRMTISPTQPSPAPTLAAVAEVEEARQDGGDRGLTAGRSGGGKGKKMPGVPRTRSKQGCPRRRNASGIRRS